MLNQLISLAKEQLSGKLKTEENLNEHQVNETMDVAKDSMFQGLKDQALSGNLTSITKLFNGKDQPDTKHQLLETVMRIFVPKLAGRLGISEGKASSIGNMVIPFLVNKFKDKDTGTAGSEKGLLEKIGMDKDSAISGLMKNFGGKSSTGGGLGSLLGR